jgi:hypothetical protein
VALVGIVTLEQTKRPLGYINCPPVASVSTSTPASARTAGVISQAESARRARYADRLSSSLASA